MHYWHDSHFTGSRVIFSTFPGPDLEVLQNRERWDEAFEAMAKDLEKKPREQEPHQQS